MIAPSHFGQDAGGGPGRLNSYDTVVGGGGGFPDPPYSPQPSDSLSEVRTSHPDSDSDSTMSDFFASELGNWNPANMVPMQPGSMCDQGGPVSSTPCSSGYGSPAQKRTGEPKRTKRRRLPVPDERKDGKYWERRRKNNVAAKRSRESRRLKQEEDRLKADHAIQENVRLRAEVDVLKSEISSLRRLLKDANTTLSLWIKARQATEPVHQLPPSLRDKNGPLSFVNFPM